MKNWYKISKEKKDDLLKALNSRAEQLSRDMEYCWNQARIYENFYHNIQNEDWTTRRGDENISVKSRLAYNVITPIVDDGFNKLKKIKPKPTFMNTSVPFFNKSKIKTLDQFVLKMFKRQKFYYKSGLALKNGLVKNCGVLKTFPNKENDNIDYSHVDLENFAVENPYEGVTERTEGMEIQRKSLFEILSEFNKDVIGEEKYQMLLDAYGLEDGCENSEDFKDQENIDVKEIFKAGKRHIIWTEKVVLYDEEWKYNFIPYDWLGGNTQTAGIISVGWVERLTALQRRINTLLMKISRSIDISMYPYILASIQAKVSKKYNDEAENVIEFHGTIPPTHVVPPAPSRDIFAHLYHMMEHAYRTLRLTEQKVSGDLVNATAKTSGIAIQNQKTVENEKYYDLAEAYENLAISVGKKTAVFGFHENINKLKDKLPLFEEFFEDIQTYPSSIFPYTPEGKIARSETLINIGAYSIEEIADLFDFPDASRLLSSKGVRIDAIWTMIENMLQMDQYQKPDPLLGYPEQSDVALKVYSLLLKEKDKDKETKLIRKFLAEIEPELRRIEKERMMMALQGNLPQEQSPPPNVGNPTNQDQQALSDSGTGQEGGLPPF